MAPTLGDRRIRTSTTWAAVAAGGVSTGGIRKSPPISPAKKSPTRTSPRLRGEAPESGPLHDTWESFASPTYKKNTSYQKTDEGVACQRIWRVDANTTESQLWTYAADRKPNHFYPGQIIVATDAGPQTWLNVPLDDPHTAALRDGPVYGKKRPMVVLWKTEHEVLCLPFRSLSGGDSDAGKWRWYDFISVTSAEDTTWKGKTPWTGPPLTFIAHGTASGLHKQTFIKLTMPILINTQSSIIMNCGRLSGGNYCRLMQAYMYSQTMHKQEAFQEYGEAANLPDGANWWEGENSPEWKQRELRMGKKRPVVVDKLTQTYKLH